MLLKQSTAVNFQVLMVDSSDHITGKAGLTLTITASKDGAAFASITPVVTDLGSGWYSLALTTTHTNTLGGLCLHVTGSGADPVDDFAQVVADLPGATVASVTGNVGGNVVGTVASVTGNVGGNVVGTVASVVGAVGSVTAVVSANLTQILGTALTETAGQIAAGFKKFFNLASPTSTMNQITLVDTVTTYTGNTPQTGDNYARIGAPAGASISADIATKLATSGYTAPDNTGIAAIQAKTDNLPASPASSGDVTSAQSAIIAAFPYGFEKNVGVTGFPFRMFDSSGAPATGLTVGVKIIKDGGAAATSTNAVSEISLGWYELDLTATEMNAKSVALNFSAVGATSYGVLLTTES